MNNFVSTFIADATWQEADEALKQNTPCVLPIGAASKEHGFHLPLNTDLLQAEWLATELAKRFSLIVWPTVSYGFYPAFVNYPGGASVSSDVFQQYCIDIFESICRHYQNPLILLNTGISTIAPLQSAIENSGHCEKVHLINVYSGQQFSAVEKAVQTQSTGGHADEIETSIMLALKPEAVHMERAVAGLDTKVAGPLQPVGSEHANYCPSGSIGDPTHASAKKGKLLLDAMLADTCDAIDTLFKAFTNNTQR
jgi:creatinine amidohydrolase